MIDLVLAHRDEALDWLAELPAHCRVQLCQSAGAVEDPHWPTPTWVHVWRTDTGAAGSHLQYLQTLAARIARGESPDLDPAGWTVFAPADALRQAPALRAQLASPALWAEVQPLGRRAGSAGAAPRQAHFCPVTLAPLGHVDADAVQLAESYRRRHALASGENLLAHFLDLAGLHGLAGQAASADLGIAAPEGVFAVRNDRVLALLHAAPDALARLDALLRSEALYRPMLERCWLHLFALPFVQLQPLPHPAQVPAELPIEVPPAMARVVASIDALLARSAPPAVRRDRPIRPLPSVGHTGLRLSAIDELRPAASARLTPAQHGAGPAWWPDPSQIGQVGARLQAHSLG